MEYGRTVITNGIWKDIYNGWNTENGQTGWNMKGWNMKGWNMK
jgi:hypothetical protein